MTHVHRPQAGPYIALTAEAGMVWLLARPIDLTETHGYDLTAERLAQMAASYNPAIEAAAINVDHVRSGDAFGWLTDVQWDGKHLTARPSNLSSEIAERVRAGKLTRVSIEFTSSHPATGGYYLTGLALLGAQTPAIWGLPPIELSSTESIYRLQEVLMPNPAPVDPPTDPQPAPQPTTPPAAQGPAAPPVAAAESVTELSVQVQLAQRERQQLANDRQQLRAERAAFGIQRQVDALGPRIPSQIASRLVTCLSALSSVENPVIVELAVDSGGTRQADAVTEILGCLSQLPEIITPGRQELAGPGADDSAPITGVTADQLSAGINAGLSSERIAELAAKYPLSNNEDPN